MMGGQPSPPGFWRTVGALLGAARKRAAGRRKRQQQLLHERSSGKSTDWSGIGYALTVLVMAILNGLAAYVVSTAVGVAQRIQVEQNGKIIVSHSFLEAANTALEYYSKADEYLEPFYGYEANEIAKKNTEERKRSFNKDFATLCVCTGAGISSPSLILRDGWKPSSRGKSS